MLYNSAKVSFLLFCILLSGQCLALPELKIAVASNFKEPLQHVLKNAPFIDDVTITISSASSGVLYAQIMHGAPFDIFLSADSVRPEKLVKQGFALKESLIITSEGVLAIWQPNKKNNNGYLAIANPTFSPYGVASNAYLKKQFAQQYKVVFANNITQAFQYVESGNAELGLVALSTLKLAQAKSKEQKYHNYTVLERGAHPEIQQKGVILANTKQLDLARQVMNYITSTKVQSQLQQLGYRSAQ